MTDYIDAAYDLIERWLPSPVFAMLNTISFAIYKAALKKKLY